MTRRHPKTLSFHLLGEHPDDFYVRFEVVFVPLLGAVVFVGKLVEYEELDVGGLLYLRDVFVTLVAVTLHGQVLVAGPEDGEPTELRVQLLIYRLWRRKS